jgi:uroporphyrinogen-III decarboxylase
MKTPDNAEKKRVWDTYAARKPVRVPLRWNCNVRIILQDPGLNRDKITFEQYFNDPQTMLAVQSQFQEYCHTTLYATCDLRQQLPEKWNWNADTRNFYDAAYFGSPVEFCEGQIPSTHAYLGYNDFDEFLKMDFSRPLENPWLKQQLALHAELAKATQSYTYQGRKGKLVDFFLGFDGPVTTAVQIFGEAIFLLMGMDPDKARQVLMTITRACVVRNRAIAGLSGGWKKGDGIWFADDSIQLVSTDMYRDIVRPAHALWYNEMSALNHPGARRHIHLCGDATRHFKTLNKELNIISFDTGFPVDHGKLRRELGPDVEISGGPHVELLANGTPEACAQAAEKILRSGVMTGGHFILQEGNNLPPKVPLENLRAVYKTCLELGKF